MVSVATKKMRAVILTGFLLGGSAQAATPGDSIYFHCDTPSADFRISDLNRSVSLFDRRSQQYRPLCIDCEVLEWGDRIRMRDGIKTVVQINRVSGQVSIQRNMTRSEGGPFENSSFLGTCRRGTMVLPKPKSNRAF